MHAFIQNHSVHPFLVSAAEISLGAARAIEGFL